MGYIIYNIKTGESFGNTKNFEEGQKIVDEYNQKTNRIGDLAIENEDDLDCISGKFSLTYDDSGCRR